MTPFLRRLPLLLVFALTAVLPARLAADLVWSHESGWRIEGGALAGQSGEEGRNALDFMNKARRAEESSNNHQAINLYQKVAKKYPNSVYAPEALYRAGLLHQRRRELFKAFDDYQNILQRYPNTERFSQIIGEQYRIATELSEGKRNYFWGVIPSLTNREKGVEYFERIVGNAPYSDYAPLSLMNVARGYHRQGSTEGAIDALDRMINNYPRSVLTPDAYLKIAQTHASLVEGPYYDQSSTKESITYYEDYMILFPGDPNVGIAEKGLSDMKKTLAESKMTIGDYYYKYRKNYTAAKVLYNEAITVYPDSTVAARARAQLVKVEAKLSAAKPAATTQAPPGPPAPKKKKHFFFF